jgi:DNA invertase Pin-like site-specific DNA recombinase
MSEPVITKIPATREIHTAKLFMDKRKTRAAGYARVSTNQEEQESSFAAQVDYYSRLIKSNPDLEFAGLYSDEGLSATTTAKRDGFNRMIRDALDGKIDMILTKSISRFARNTVDTLTTVRKLLDRGCFVRFEKENIDTSDPKAELILSIMSSLAQEESRSLSENTTWGQRKRMADGKINLPYKRFIGYEKGSDGKPCIVESEAKVVRHIYSLFLRGWSTKHIASHLTAEAVLTPSGKASPWSESTVRSILTNEKYIGDALQQKTFTVSYLTKKKKVNEGEVAQYYIRDSHPAIIQRDVFEMTQEEMVRRKTYGSSGGGRRIFSGKIICGQCGGLYCAKTWHSNDKYRKVIWRCSHKYEYGTHCQTPHLSDTQIEIAFVQVFGQAWQHRANLLEDYAPVLAMLGDTSDVDKEAAALEIEGQNIERDTAALVDNHAKALVELGEYHKQYDSFNIRHDEIMARLAELASERSARFAKRDRVASFLESLDRPTPLESFDEDVWCAAVEQVSVQTDGTLVFRFRDESEASDHIVKLVH